MIGEDVRLVTRFAPRRCLTKIDTGQVDQVLMNLAVNARDAMPNGGTLTVETRLFDPDEHFLTRHPDARGNRLVCLSVSDTGCGMADDVKSQVFEPFFTTKEKGRGTGLGLAMVFGIIKQSGGEIEIEGEPGRGTTFFIYLPLLDGDEEIDARSAGSGAAATGSETVLLVEDEDSIRRFSARALANHGYTVMVASNAEDALRLIEAHGRPVDLLITDVVMPGASGRELARRLAQRDAARRTLFMSGYTEDAIVQHGVLEAGLAFMAKPFTSSVLLRKVRAVLDGPVDQARA